MHRINVEGVKIGGNLFQDFTCVEVDNDDMYLNNQPFGTWTEVNGGSKLSGSSDSKCQGETTVVARSCKEEVVLTTSKGHSWIS